MKIKTSVFLCALLFCAQYASAGYVFEPEVLTKIAIDSRTEILNVIDENDPGTLKAAMTFYETSMVHKVGNYTSKITLPAQDEIVRSYITELILANTIKKLNEEYPGLLIDEPAWIWNNVGTVWARMIVLYCSTKEYMVIFGTQFPQEGFSGYYKAMDVWDIMITGQMKSHGTDPHDGLSVIYNPGDVSLLVRESSRIYHMDNYTYMIDYGRGTIARAFYQGVIAPHFFINHDNYSMAEQLSSCGSHAIKNLADGKVDGATGGRLSKVVGKILYFLSKIL